MSRIVAAIATVIVVTTLAACDTDSTPDRPEVASFKDQVAQARADAVSAGATEAQLALLDEAAKNGVATVEEVSAARDAFAACLLPGGYKLVDRGMSTANGYPYPEYEIQSPDDEDDENQAFVDKCEDMNFNFIDGLYQLQPQTQDARRAQFAKVAPQLIKCLNDGGLKVPEDVTPDELRQIMVDDLKPVDDPNYVATDREALVPTCVGEVGLGSF